MTINQTKEGANLTLALEGRLDTTTAPQLEEVVKNEFGDVKHVELDFANLNYLSSAGLRVILAAQKIMNKQGDMVLRNVNDTIMEVFEVTGFTDVLTISNH